MHLKWEKELLGIEINTELGYAAVERDDSKIISSHNEIYWMFSIVDRNTKEAKVHCVLKYRIKARLMPIIKKYVHPNCQILEEQDDEFEDEDENIRTRVFSDCFLSYQVSDFKNEGLS